MLVLTAETLVIVAGVAEELVSRPFVRTPNFNNKANYVWREILVMNDRTLRSVAHFTTTSRETKHKDSNSTHFNYWNAAGTMYTSDASRKAVSMHEPRERDEPAGEVFSGGWNCTCTVGILAQEYKM